MLREDRAEVGDAAARVADEDLGERLADHPRAAAAGELREELEDVAAAEVERLLVRQRLRADGGDLGWNACPAYQRTVCPRSTSRAAIGSGLVVCAWIGIEAKRNVAMTLLSGSVRAGRLGAYD